MRGHICDRSSASGCEFMGFCHSQSKTYLRWELLEIECLTFLISCFQPPVVTPQEQLSGTLNPTGFMYQMTLNICLIGLCAGLVCGCVYEVIRKRKKEAKVGPEGKLLFFKWY